MHNTRQSCDFETSCLMRKREIFGNIAKAKVIDVPMLWYCTVSVLLVQLVVIN